MPTSMIDIDVNDSKFKEFLETFKKYEDQLKEMPGSWRAFGKEASESSKTILALQAALLAINLISEKHTEELRKQAKVESDAAAKQRAANAAQSKAERDRAAANKKAVEDTKRIAKNVADTTMNLLKWATIDVLIGGAGSLWGLDKVIDYAGEQRRLATGLNVSIGQRQALETNFQNLFDVNSSLANVSGSTTDVSKQWIWSALGINPRGQDNSQLLIKAADIISRQSKGMDQYTLANVAQARGWTELFSMQDILRLRNETPEGMASRERQEALNEANMRIADQTAEKFQVFSNKLKSVELTIENHFVNKLVELNKNGQIDRIIDSLTKLALSLVDNQLPKVISGLGNWASTFDEKTFIASMNTLVADTEAVAGKFDWLLKKLGIIPSNLAAQPHGGGIVSVGVGAAGGAAVGTLFGPLGTLGGGAIGAMLGFMHNGAQYSRLVQLENDYGLKRGTLSALYAMESNYGKDPNAYKPNRVGAEGPFQFMPETAAQYGVHDRLSFYDESVGAAKYMRDSMRKYHGDLAESIASFNLHEADRYDKRTGRTYAGLDTLIKRYGSGWLSHAPKETRDYVQRGLVYIQLNNQTGASVSMSSNAIAGG